MSSRSPKIPYADAVSRLAEANAKRVKENKAPLTMDKNGDITLSNKAVAAYVLDSKTGKPRFQIYKGAPRDYLLDIQKERDLGAPDAEGVRHRNYEALSLEQAEGAWRRAFAKKSYKTEAGRKRAMSRNKCHPCSNPKDTTNNSRFLNNPTKLCFTGLNDGSTPDCADRVAKYANPSQKSKDARAVSARKLKEWQGKVFSPDKKLGKDKKMHHTLDLAKVAANSKNPTETLKHLSKHNSGRVSKPYNRSKRAQAGGHQEEEEEQQGGYQQEEEEEQQGGRAVSLKTAVRLLRQYYNSKYN